MAFNPTAAHGNEVGWAEETSPNVQTVPDLAPGAPLDQIVASSPNGNDLNVAENFG